jgi:hypothetical protein
MNELFRAQDDCYSPFLGQRRRNLKLLAWKRSCTKSGTNNPSHIIVGREVKALFALGVDPDEEDQVTREQYLRYRKHEERIAVATQHATRFLAEGGLDLFLHSQEEQRQKPQKVAHL